MNYKTQKPHVFKNISISLVVTFKVEQPKIVKWMVIFVGKCICSVERLTVFQMFLRKAASSKGAESDEEANGVDNSDADLDSLPEGWNKNILFNWNDNLMAVSVYF